MTQHPHISQAILEKQSELHDWHEYTSANLKALDTLDAIGERRRLGRVGTVPVTETEFNPHMALGFAQGSHGERYSVRITVSPKRGHHCTCPDWQQNGLKVGPCKHVLALSAHWRTHMLITLNHVSATLSDLIETVRK